MQAKKHLSKSISKTLYVFHCLKLHVAKIGPVSTWLWVPVLNCIPSLISFCKYISKKQVAEIMMKGHLHAHLWYEYLSWSQLSQNWKLDLNIKFGYKNWQDYLFLLITLRLCLLLFMHSYFFFYFDIVSHFLLPLSCFTTFFLPLCFLSFPYSFFIIVLLLISKEYSILYLYYYVNQTNNQETKL